MNRLAEHDANGYPHRICIRNRAQGSLFVDQLERCSDLISKIRTDLNMFTKDEVIALVLHGAGEAHRALGTQFTISPGEEPIANRILDMLRVLLGLNAGASLIVERRRLANSHRIRLGGWRWRTLYVITCITALVGLWTVSTAGSAVLTYLAENGYTHLTTAPKMRMADDMEADALYQRFAKQIASNVNPEMLKDGKRRIYVTESSFYAPNGGIVFNLQIERAVYMKISDAGARHVRAYFDGAPRIGQLIPLENIAWQMAQSTNGTDETPTLTIKVPRQATEGRMWVILPDGALATPQ
jgi:hypothetical protein